MESGPRLSLVIIEHEGEHASPEIQCALYLPGAAANIYQHDFSPLAPFLKFQPLCSEGGGGRESRGDSGPLCWDAFVLSTMASHREF